MNKRLIFFMKLSLYPNTKCVPPCWSCNSSVLDDRRTACSHGGACCQKQWKHFPQLRGSGWLSKQARLQLHLAPHWWVLTGGNVYRSLELFLLLKSVAHPSSPLLFLFCPATCIFKIWLAFFKNISLAWKRTGAWKYLKARFGVWDLVMAESKQELGTYK